MKRPKKRVLGLKSITKFTRESVGQIARTRSRNYAETARSLCLWPSLIRFRRLKVSLLDKGWRDDATARAVNKSSRKSQRRQSSFLAQWHRAVMELQRRAEADVRETRRQAREGSREARRMERAELNAAIRQRRMEISLRR
jgi:hypothetical protein